MREFENDMEEYKKTKQGPTAVAAVITDDKLQSPHLKRLEQWNFELDYYHGQNNQAVALYDEPLRKPKNQFFVDLQPRNQSESV